MGFIMMSLIYDRYVGGLHNYNNVWIDQGDMMNCFDEAVPTFFNGGLTSHVR